MGTYFGNQQAALAKGWYERLIYTGTAANPGPVASLPMGITPVFGASSWNTGQDSTWQARIEMLQATQNAGVLLQLASDPQNADNAVSQGYASAMPSGLRQLEMNVNGIQSLKLGISNISGSAVSDYYLNYAVAMKRLTAVDKLERQYAGQTGYSLSQQETAALKQLDLLKPDGSVDKSGLQQMQQNVVKGTAPASLERIAQGVWRNRELAGPADLFAPQSSTADNPYVTYQAHLDGSNPSKGRFPVLVGVAIEGGSTLNTILSVDRDGQLGYMQISTLGFAQTDDSEWRCFIPATNYLTFHVINGPGQSATIDAVPIRLRVAELAMSEILAVQLGRVTNPSQLSRSRNYYATIAGLV